MKFVVPCTIISNAVTNIFTYLNFRISFLDKVAYPVLEAMEMKLGKQNLDSRNELLGNLKYYY